MRNARLIFLALVFGVFWACGVSAQGEQDETSEANLSNPSNESIPLSEPNEENGPTEPSVSHESFILDDKMLLDGYSKKYAEEPKEFLLAMIKDDDLTPYMSAAALRIFRQRFSQELVGSEKKITEKILLRRLNRTNSNFVEIEVMHILCVMDRYRYFGSFIPLMIELIDHQNSSIGELAFNSVNEILLNGPKRSREARIVFNTLRKNLFLSRQTYEDIDEPGPKLKQKLELLRWAIKVLGTQELQRLPPKIIDFL